MCRVASRTLGSCSFGNMGAGVNRLHLEAQSRRSDGSNKSVHCYLLVYGILRFYYMVHVVGFGDSALALAGSAGAIRFAREPIVRIQGHGKRVESLPRALGRCYRV